MVRSGLDGGFLRRLPVEDRGWEHRGILHLRAESARSDHRIREVFLLPIGSFLVVRRSPNADNQAHPDAGGTNGARSRSARAGGKGGVPVNLRGRGGGRFVLRR